MAKHNNSTRIIAAIATLVIHLILFILLINIYLEHAVPQEEEGLEVQFGSVDITGDEFFEPAPAEEIAQELEEISSSTPESNVEPSEEEVQTQDLEESVEMKKEKSPEEIKREKELAEQKRIEREKQLAEERRLAEERKKKAEEERKRDSIRNAISKQTSGLKGLGNGTGGTGNAETGGSNGPSGNPFGSLDSNRTDGSSASGNNSPFSLQGRSIRGVIVRPTYSEQVEGRIVVNITVDKDGNVVRAERGKGTTVDNANVINAAIEAAKKNKFTPTTKDGLQSGTITYDLKLK